MSKQEKVEVNKGATKVASAVAKVFGDVAKQGNIITQCVIAVKAVYKGAEVPKADQSFIANNVARQRGWSERSAASRKSEVRKILRNYMTIPEAMQLYSKKADTFTWHEAMRLCVSLNGGNTPKQAVAALLSANTATKTVNAVKRFATLITGIQNLETRSTKIIAFRKDLTALLAKHNL